MIYLQRNGDNIITAEVRDCNESVIEQREIPDIMGFSLRDMSSHSIQLASFSAESGSEGILITSNQQAIDYVSQLTEGQIRGARGKRSQRMQRQAFTFESINNPIICINSGEGLMFQIIQDRTNSSLHYPVYVKDHLLNSNPSFDYGSFRQLSRAIESSININNLFHVFNDPGSYVFADSIIPTNELIVVVLTSCEREDDNFRVFPVTNQYLARYGITSVQVTNVEPNFVTITVILLVTLFLVIFITLGTLIWKKPVSKYITLELVKPRYRRVDAPILNVSELSGDLGNMEMKGSNDNISFVSGSHVKPDIPFLLENFNIRTFYDKLEDQNLYVSAQLARQKKDLQIFYDTILQKTECLKDLVSKTQVMAILDSNRQFQAENSPHLEERGEPVGSDSPNSTCSLSEGCKKRDDLVAILNDIISTASNISQNDKIGNQKNKASNEARIESRTLLGDQLQNDLALKDLRSVVDDMNIQVLW